MKRYREDRPTQISFARGTFNSHPYVMGAMNEFLRRIEEPEIRNGYAQLDKLWDDRVMQLNNILAARGLPVKIINLASIWTVVYTRPSRYNWMFQYYLRTAGLTLSWIGSGRFIMSHNYSDEDYAQVMQRIVAAAAQMQEDGWWWQDASLTNKSIKQQILREMLTAAFGRWRQKK